VPLVLGVAFGPHATVAEVRDADTGALRGTGRVERTELGGGDEDPTVWWRSLLGAIARTGEREVAALALSGGHPGLVLVDDAGVVLRPVRPWDGARAEVVRVRQALGSERWARRAGSVPDASTAVTRLAWLRRTDRATFARIGTVLLPHEWLTFRLAGKAVTDRGSASTTGLWSPHTGRWIPDVVELLAPEGRRDEWVERLPEVLGPSDRADWLDAPVFEQLGLRGRPLVAPGTAEPMAIALALGLARGSIGVALGDRTTVLAPLDAPLVDGSGAVQSRADATGRHLAVAGAPGGAGLVHVVADLLGMRVDELGRAALAAGPPDDDLVVVPGVEGRRGAVVTGLGAGASREALARATFEGITCAALAGVEAALEAGARWFQHEPIHLTGPPEGLDVHARVLATLSGRRVVATPGNLAAAGACAQAAAVLAEVPPESVAAAWDLGSGTAVDPAADDERAHRYAVHAEERDRQERAWGV
jgi:xylulokinase